MIGLPRDSVTSPEPIQSRAAISSVRYLSDYRAGGGLLCGGELGATKRRLGLHVRAPLLDYRVSTESLGFEVRPQYFGFTMLWNLLEISNGN